jgi:abortive infection bacteriophage resistance protein
MWGRGVDDKPALSIEEQVKLLRSRGLVTAGREDKLKSYLRRVGYYRLSGYWRYWQETPGRGDNRFYDDVTVDDVLDAYDFDSMLRSIVLEGVEALEVGFKASFARTWALAEGPTAYLDVAHLNLDKKARDGQPYAFETLAKLQVELDASAPHHALIAHHRSRGVEVPIWAALEVQTLGTVSRLYKVCANNQGVRQPVASDMGLRDVEMAESVLEGMAVLRNHAAHQHRIWNRTGLIGIRLPNAWRSGAHRHYLRTPWALLTALGGIVQHLQGRHCAYETAWARLQADYPHMLDGLKEPHRK